MNPWLEKEGGRPPECNGETCVDCRLPYEPCSCNCHQEYNPPVEGYHQL